MTTITLELPNDQDTGLFLRLAQLLGAKAHVTTSASETASEAHQQHYFEQIAGSWSEEDANGIERAIEESKAEQRLLSQARPDIEL